MPNIYNPNKFDLGFFLDEQRNQTYQLATSSIPNPIQGSQLLISYSFPKKHVYIKLVDNSDILCGVCLLYTSPSPRDRTRSRMPSSA